MRMTEDFRDLREDAASRRGASGVLRLWLRTAADFIRRAPQEHLDVLRRDASHAIRILRKRPASTATVVLSLASLETKCRDKTLRPAPRFLHIDAVYNTALEGGPVPVRLNITMDADLYRRLKKGVPPKGISAFISHAVRARIYPDRKALDEAYKAASKETWRRQVAGDWGWTDTDEWPE